MTGQISDARKVKISSAVSETIYCVIGVPWQLIHGRWTVNRPGFLVDAIPIPPLPFAGARTERERITKQDNDEFGATVWCPGCKGIKDGKRAQAHSDCCRVRIEECLWRTPQGTERLDRRSQVINEALAEELQRDTD